MEMLLIKPLLLLLLLLLKTYIKQTSPHANRPSKAVF